MPTACSDGVSSALGRTLQSVVSHLDSLHVSAKTGASSRAMARHIVDDDHPAGARQPLRFNEVFF